MVPVYIILTQALMVIQLSTGIDNINSFEDFNSLWDSWNDLVFAALNTYVPKVNCKHANRPSWITNNSVKTKRRLYGDTLR